jgi:hypothetical protein
LRAIDAKVLEELDMLYGDKDCFTSLHDWFGDAKAYWTDLERLLIVADYAKKHHPSCVEEITRYSKRILELFNQTKEYTASWSSKYNKKSTLSTEDYTDATDQSWTELEAWTVSQERLRQEILDFIEFLYSIDSQT